MQKIEGTDRVKLDPKEQEVFALFHAIVAEGEHGLIAAAMHALSVLPEPDPEFAAWLVKA